MWMNAVRKRRWSAASAAASAASSAAPSCSSRSALATSRSAFLWYNGRMYASVMLAMERRTLFSPQPAQAPSPLTSAS